MANFSKRMGKVSGKALQEILKYSSNPEITSFSLGGPAKELYPITTIKDLVNKILDQDGSQLLSYGVSEGWLPLRKAFLKHIAWPKGVKAELENVIITTGATQAIELLVEVFIDDGDVVLVESPTFLTTLGVFNKYSANCIAVETDDDGLILEDLEAKIKKHKPKMLYTIPTFQNPTGKTLPLDRRKKIAQLASNYDFIVMEDDPYCDLRYKGKAIPPIKTFDETGNVVLINSFSKILSPGLRVGTITATPDIIKQLLVAKLGADTHTTNLAQAICGEFLNSGMLPDHIKSMLPLYTERLNGMLEAVEKYFPEGTKYTKPEGGLFIWADLPGNLNTNELLSIAANEYKVAYVPGTPFYLNEKGGENSVRLNFSSNDTDVNEAGIKVLGDFFKSRLK